MATMDVLAPSNWTSTTSGLTEWSSETVGWDGSKYHSEGKVTLSGCTETSGLRVTSADFAFSATLNVGWADPVAPRLKIVLTNSSVLFDGTITGLTSQAFSAYDETLTDIDSVAFSAVNNWTAYMYQGGGGTGDTFYYLDLTALSFTYTPSAPPYLWQDYRNTIEIPS
jgi:hypothetical protein